jgi:hypothetical protein
MNGLIVIAVSALIVAGCGGGDTCETLVDSAIELVQDAIDELDGMSVEDLAAAEGDGPEAFRRLETEGAALEERAADLGCTSEEIAGLLADRVDRLEADSDYGQAIIESIRSGRVVFSGG